MLERAIPFLLTLLISEDENIEEYNEEEKGIIIQANAIPVELWEAMLIWAKKENKLSLIRKETDFKLY